MGRSVVWRVHVVIHVTSVVDWFRMSTGGGGPERARVEWADL